jgi:hypothetical protein
MYVLLILLAASAWLTDVHLQVYSLFVNFTNSIVYLADTGHMYKIWKLLKAYCKAVWYKDI